MSEFPILTLAQARRIALAAQGFGEARPKGTVTARHILKTIDRIALLQIDSVNVLARAHYLPLFSRLGPYPREVLDRLAWGKPRKLFEYWAHEASLLPMATQPLLRWRMARAREGQGTWGALKDFAHGRRDEAEALLERIRQDGPMTASALDVPKGEGGWWGWSDGKRAMEWLFWSGLVTAGTRKTSFERVYDLPHKVMPKAVHEAEDLPEHEQHRGLIRLAAKALGVATASDLRDYFRQSPKDADPEIAALVEAGELIEVKVQGWSQRAYLHPEAKRPRRIKARALLAPFDPLIWERPRTERLFGVRVRLEIYTPAHKRTHGYYVLPFLLDEAIVARVDLKSDRAEGVLRVQSAHAEPGAPERTATELAAELAVMAEWLGLQRVEVQPKGDLAERLAAAV